MNLSLAEICSAATALVQGRTNISLSNASFWANLAYQEVATRIKYTAQEQLAVSSTTSGENKISVPSDYAYAIGLSNLSIEHGCQDRGLIKREAQGFDSYRTALGVPTHYADYATWVELWPSPDSSYSMQLRYGAKLASLISSTATPAIDERWHLGIAYKTAEMLAAANNDLESEAVNRQRYIGYMGSTPTDAALRQRDKESMRVRLIR